MSKLLKNPVAVIVLAVLAVGFAFRGPISNLFSKKKNVTLESAAAEEQQQDKPAAIEFSAIAWDANSGRNPFRPSQALSPVAALGSDAGPVGMANFARQKLALSAIWIQDGGRWAILNQQILAVGESVDGFRVVAIQPEFVDVSGPGGRERIPFGSTPRAAMTGVQVEVVENENETNTETGSRATAPRPEQAIISHPLISPILTPPQP